MKAAANRDQSKPLRFCSSLFLSQESVFPVVETLRRDRAAAEKKMPPVRPAAGGRAVARTR